MEKLKFLSLILVAILVTQVTNAQIVREEWVVPIENDWIYCLDENISGTLVYDVKYKYDKEGNLVKFSLHSKSTFLVGETTGNTYKLIDLHQEKYGVPAEAGEFMANGVYKLISLGEGITYNGRVQVHIDVDKNGDLIYKKQIWDLCF